MALYGKLFHRHDEWSKLRQAYDTRNERHLVVTVGAAGTGKTALIEACLREKVHDDQGFFVQGRFDYLDHPDPYSPWIDSAGQLVSSIISQCSPDDLGTVVNSVEKNMESSELAALATLIPLLGVMMNKTPTTDYLKNPTVTGRFDFLLIFGNFLRGVTALKRPIVWFLDNVHNADASSLEVIKLFLVDDHISDVLPIIALRPVGPEHPTSTFLEGLDKSEVDLVPIFPSSIPGSAIEEWVATSYGNFTLTNPQPMACGFPVFSVPVNLICSRFSPSFSTTIAFRMVLVPPTSFYPKSRMRSFKRRSAKLAPFRRGASFSTSTKSLTALVATIRPPFSKCSSRS